MDSKTKPSESDPARSLEDLLLKKQVTFLQLCHFAVLTRCFTTCYCYVVFAAQCGNQKPCALLLC